MSILPNQKMFDTLDKFFAEKTIIDVDRNTYLVCNLNDTVNKITISLVFMRDWHSIESDDYNYVSIENTGAVFTFPCYWISIPKELTMQYFISVINQFYAKEVSSWSGIDSGSSSGSTGTGSNMPCGTGHGCSCNLR